MVVDHDTDSVLEWLIDGQPATWSPDLGALEAAKVRGLIVPARGGGYQMTQDGEFAAAVLA